MHPLRTSLRSASLVLAVMVLSSCGEGPAAERITASESPMTSTSSASTLIECPVDSTVSKTATIDLLGGTLELDGHKLVVPANAVLLPTEFTLTVPASNHLEVDIKAAGEEHFQFEQPVSLTLSYARCSRSNINKKDLKVFYIDAATKAILEDMGGTDDKTSRTVTTGTDHLSGYAIGQG
jgi:hypothetical protein